MSVADAPMCLCRMMYVGRVVLNMFQTSALDLCARAQDCICIGEVREDVCIVHGTNGLPR